MIPKEQAKVIREFMDIFEEAATELAKLGETDAYVGYGAIDLLADVLLPRGYTVLDNADFTRLAGDSHAPNGLMEYSRGRSL